MTTYLQTLGRSAYALLPQNEHTKNVEAIETQILELNQALSDPATTKFREVLIEKREQLHLEKEKWEKSLDRLNGAFYEDPESSLKQTWDTAVENTHLALGTELSFREQLPSFSEELEGRSKEERSVKKATLAINQYTRLEKKRNQIEIKLKDIVATEKSGPLGAAFQAALLEEKTDLQQRHKVLCGNHYQDPNGLLHKAWKAAEQAANHRKTDAPDLLNNYNELDTERKRIDARLYRLDQYISVVASPERTIEVLTEHSITEQLSVLESQKVAEAALSGIDWGEAAQNAGQTLVNFAKHNKPTFFNI